MKINSDDENIEIVGENKRVMGVGSCEGIKTSVCKLEREYEESLQVQGWQRVNFSRGVVGDEEKSSRVYLVDESSTNNCPWSFGGVPGRARRCFYVAVPSAWIERESVKWGSEIDFERVRVIELFKLKRGYRELVGMVDIERVDNIEFLPCDMVSAARGDTNVDDLPVYKVGLLVVDDYYNEEMINDLIVTANTKGELTIPNVDRFYELLVCNNVGKYYLDTMDKIDDDGYYNNNNKMYLIKNELCIRKTRLLFDDGG